MITYLSQLNPINTHKPRPFTIPCSSLPPPHPRLPLPKWNIPLLFQLKLFVCTNPPPDVCYMFFYHANYPNIWYTQTLLLYTFLYPCDISRLLITYIIFSTLVYKLFNRYTSLQ